MKLLLIFFFFFSFTIGEEWKDHFIHKPKHPLTGISSQCANDTNTWLNSLHLLKKVTFECLITKKCTKQESSLLKENFYALEQLDSFGKLPNTGIFEIPLIFEGSYQECERISGVKYETNYCYMLLVPGKNSSHCALTKTGDLQPTTVFFRSAVCMPMSCDKNDLSPLINQISDMPFTACGAACSKYPVKKDSAFWGFTVFLIVMICVVVLASAFDYHVLLPITGFTKHLWNHILLNAFVSVDTFFLLSGIVVAYLFFKSRPKRSQIQSPITWILFYVHRFLRLTPPYMIFLGFYIVYSDYVQGPNQAAGLNAQTINVESCKGTWWRNLLYINNFGDSIHACYGISWYLAVDTQLYLVAPIILVAFYISFLWGTVAVTSGCLGSIIAVYVLYGQYNLPADQFGKGNMLKFGSLIYQKPWIRCTPYLLGLLVGYGLANYGKRRVRIPWILAVLGWLVSFGIAAACLFATNDYDKGAYWSPFEKATYYNFSRFTWAIAVSWVIVANHMGWGGPINAFMSHPIWQPLGRLSYCAYIVHFFLISWYVNISATPLHYYSTFQIWIYYAVPICLIAYIFAFFWSCFFEIPVLKLEKMLIEALIGHGRTSGKVGDVEKEVEKTKI